MAGDQNTVMDYTRRWLEQCPDRIWLRERTGDERREWSWQSAHDEFQAVAAWLESEFGHGNKVGILSRNRAHWTLADMATLASGNVSIPFFTTLTAEVFDYVMKFAEVKLLVVGEADNWDKVRPIVGKDVRVLLLPGVNVEAGNNALRWEDIVDAHQGQTAKFECKPDTVFTIPFTSGTTGMPKGVMQTHDSMIIPIERSSAALKSRTNSRFLSYLPLSHIAERQLVWINSIINCGSVQFNEDLGTLVRDMAEVRPNFFFGAPRVWEMLRQGVLGKFGGQDAFDAAMNENPEALSTKVQAALGFDDYDYLLSGAAPIPVSLLNWYAKLGIQVREGFGQTEAMALILNTINENRVGSIGKPVKGVEVRLSDEEELLCRGAGLSPGYYKDPEKTAETFVDGWVHTGDKARIDEDGFVFITGRVKDYFKTIHGKFVTPVPLEDAFAHLPSVEQLCLLGRGYSKTVMVCVLSEAARQSGVEAYAESLRQQAESVNGNVEKHARIGAVIVTNTPWTIENGLLTPTLKLKRNKIEEAFGTLAEELGRKAAETGSILVEAAP